MLGEPFTGLESVKKATGSYPFRATLLAPDTLTSSPASAAADSSTSAAMDVNILFIFLFLCFCSSCCCFGPFRLQDASVFLVAVAAMPLHIPSTPADPRKVMSSHECSRPTRLAHDENPSNP